MRLVIARCQVDYAGRLSAHLPMATRLILIKADGSVSIHADDRAYKPLNWMSPPCSLVELEASGLESVSMAVAEPLSAIWEVRGRDGDTLQICLAEVYHDSFHDLGIDPGCRKTASRRICRHFSPHIPRRWRLVYRWSVESIPRQSDRSICCAGTPGERTWR